MIVFNHHKLIYDSQDKFQTFEIFQYFAHAQIQNTVKNAKKTEKHKKIFETSSHERHEI